MSDYSAAQAQYEDPGDYFDDDMDRLEKIVKLYETMKCTCGACKYESETVPETGQQVEAWSYYRDEFEVVESHKNCPICSDFLFRHGISISKNDIHEVLNAVINIIKYV